MSRFRIVICVLCLAAGCLMVLAAWLVSNRALEHALLGTVRSLDWGTTLFRGLLTVHGIAFIIAALACWRSRQFAAYTLGSQNHKAINDPAPIKKYSWLVLTALSLIALGLRLWHLNSDLWYDELISLLEYFRPPMGRILTSFASQNQHMLYSILAHTSISIFGESAAAVRLPSVLFGVASLWALFLLGRRLIGVRESLLACTLMTFSYHHIWFSQNARGYMGLLLFSTLATWLFLEALKKNALMLWIGYSIAVSLGMWLHMTMVFVVAAHGLIYLGAWLVQRALRDPANWIRLSWKPFVGWLLCVTLSLQLHALALPEFVATALHQPSPPSEWSSIWWLLFESLRSLQIGFSGIVVALAGMALMALGFFTILKRNVVAALAMVLPALIGGATMLALDHYIWPRFFFFSIGFAILIAVHGAICFPSFVLKISEKLNLTRNTPPDAAQLAGMALACLLIAASVFTLPRLYALPKQDFTGARDWVERSRLPSDAVVAVGLAGVAYGRYFAPNWSVAQSQAELDAVRNESANVWLVYILPPQLKSSRAELWNTIQKDFETVEIFPGTLGGGAVYVCRQRDTKQARYAPNQQNQTSNN